MAQNLIAFIPVRGGSKSIPGKNIKMLAGKPLVHWVIEAALACREIDQVYVATDSDEITRALVKFTSREDFRIVGRSAATATDEASTETAMLEFAREHRFDSLVLIQATSPLLRSQDLQRGIKLYQSGFDSLLSVVRQKRFVWNDALDGTALPINYNPKIRPRRQEFNGYLVENGAFYITSRQSLLKSGSRLSGRIGFVEMAEESYYELDEPVDWIIIEQLLLNHHKEGSVWQERASRIRLVVSDVDGVLTDAGMYYSETGDELKKFNTRDGMGLSMLRQAGIKIALVTSENTDMVARRAAKLKIDYLFQGVTDKLTCINRLAAELALSLDEICFIGDDHNDIELLRQVGLACCPADASLDNQLLCHYVAKRKGGEGCVREVVDCLLGNVNGKAGI